VEREQEITKLVNVLHKIGRSAAFSSWVKRDAETARFCAAQYNRVLSRLREIEPAAASLFGELAADASANVTRMAAHDLAAYFEDEIPARPAHHGAHRRRPRHMAFAFSRPHGRRC
jgi:hypothetical protein